MPSRTGFGKPGRSTGGLIREASGHGVRVHGGPIADRWTGQGNAGDISRGDHQREPERDLAVAYGSTPQRVSSTVAALAGHEVADAEVEDARPVLLGDRRATTLGDRLVVMLACLASLLEDAVDLAAGNLIRNRVTAARSGSGKMYAASSGSSNALTNV